MLSAYSSSAATTSEEQSQLRIVSKAPDKVEAADKDDAVSVDSQATSGEMPITEEISAKNRELEEQLVVTLEGLDKVERDNAELFDRMEKMSEQLESVQRLLQLKDQQMADLQNKLVVAQTQTVQSEMAPVPAQPQPSKGIVETLMQTPALLAAAGAGLLALLLGLLFVVRKRKQGGDDDQAVEQAMAVLEEREKTEQTAEKSEPEVTESVEAIPEEALEEVAVDEDPDDPFNLSVDEDAGEFDALISDDLDMDLKIDEPVDEDPEMAEFAASLLDDEEYDIATDEGELDISDEEVSASEEQEDALEVAEDAVEEMEPADDIDDDLDFILSAGAEESTDEESDLEEGLPEDESDLDFVVSDSLDGDDLAIEEASEETSELGADDSMMESDELDSILGEAPSEDQDDVSDELEDLLEEHAAAESRGMDTVAHHEDGDDDLVDDGALDDLLSIAEDHGSQSDDVEAGESNADTEGADLEALDLDSLDLDADELSGEDAAAAIEGESEEQALDGLDLGDTDELADELDMALEPEPEKDATDSGELNEVVEAPELAEEVAEVTEEELPAFEFDETDEVVVADELVAEPQESELDAAGDTELEEELNLMLEEDGNELSLEETTVSEADEELNYLDAADELGTKLDLARAYIDMDDPEGAKDILQEVIKDGSAEQVTEAQSLLDTLQ